MDLTGLAACRGVLAHLVKAKSTVRADLFTRVAADAALDIDTGLAGGIFQFMAVILFVI